MKHLTRFVGVLTLFGAVGCGASPTFPSPNTPDGRAVEVHAANTKSRKEALQVVATTSKVVGIMSVIGGPPMLVAGATTGDQPAVAAGATMLAAGIGLVATGYLLEMEARKARELQISQELQAFRIYRRFCQDLAMAPAGTAHVLPAETTECRKYGYVVK